MSVSPLRYPGGKFSLSRQTKELMRLNDWTGHAYAEPFAGGGGLALDLLFNGYVREIHLNDLDPAIYAFWHCVLHETDNFIDLINHTDVTIDEWYKQREIYRASPKDKLKLGFSAFFLNRTNRSGIIKAGVIGGKNQAGEYKLDCRFNKTDLIERIRRIKSYSSQINLTQLDAIEFIEQIDCSIEYLLLFIDPPYYEKGSGLYSNFYHSDDHKSLAERVKSIQSDWVLTYDFVPHIQKLYKTLPQYRFDIRYSAQVKRLGNELLITKPGVVVPDHFNSVQPFNSLQLNVI